MDSVCLLIRGSLVRAQQREQIEKKPFSENWKAFLWMQFLFLSYRFGYSSLMP